MSVSYTCPSCSSTNVATFYEVAHVPAHSVLLMSSREEALSYPTGTIRLGHCHTCGFIFNVAFDPKLHEYSARYEETQGFSPTFNAFSQSLAQRLIDRYDLHGKDIIEIGCGKGEFLTLLCEMGGNRGVGFDPAYVAGRAKSESDVDVRFIPDFYSEKYATYHADAICCKMTLEHIDQTAEFVTMVQRAAAGQPNTLIFFQVPDVTRILQEIAFWDIYYEHCSYFSPGSLARLFRRCGFDVLDLATDYGDQYILIEARLRGGYDQTFPKLEDDLAAISNGIDAFAATIEQERQNWRHFVQQIREKGERLILWGAGSKGVAFLTTLGLREEVDYAVDINPHKHGTYMAGTGQQIVAPDFLRDYQPNVVILMNPVYREEVARDLNRLGLAPTLIALGETPVLSFR